jgi:hypothetical protein
MSTKYTGGFITKSPVAPTSSAASGIWTLDQQQQAQKAGTWPSPPIFIEDLFSTYLYTGTGASQTITNGINLSGNGGLVWTKCRSLGRNHYLIDTVRGGDQVLESNTTTGNQFTPTAITAFGTTGYTIDTTSNLNANTNTFVSWTFREQPKFFDIVTYTGDGVARTIAHNLGSTPGCMIIKRTDTTGGWAVYHRSLTSAAYALALDGANAEFSATYFNSTAPTSTVFSVGAGNTVNASGGTYVAYLFAHDAGGFPASGSGSTNAISCGSYTGSSTVDVDVNLGYEPQWVMIKNVTTGATDWYIADIMRGMALTGIQPLLAPNLSDAETGFSGTYFTPTATGMKVQYGSGTAICSAGNTYIYIAIRRGPMKTPTVGTSVFSPQAYTGTGAARTIDTSQTFLDSYIVRRLPGSGDNTNWLGRLTGSNALQTNADNAEGSIGSINWASQDLAFTGANYNTNNSAQNYVAWTFQRAPSFFDEVCYTGTGSATTQTHNLGVVPEMMIVKKRSAAGTDWNVYSSALGATQTFYLNQPDAAVTSSGAWNNTTPTSSVFTVGTSGTVNASGATYVAYLFATVAGVSKVGSYTGTGAAQTINCGFTTGARFVLIKRTDSTGDWNVWDSARGIIPANDPYLALNSTAAEVTGTDYVDTTNVGFDITSTAPAEINANGGTFIFLAIA